MCNCFSAGWGCFWGLLERTTTGVLSCGNTKTETRPCGCYRQHTPQTALHTPKKQLRPGSERPQQPPPCACGRRAVRAAVCGVGRSCAHTNTQLAPPRWLCSQCRSSARRWVWAPWMWLRAIAPLRGGTAPTTRGRATGKQDQPMTKNSELGCQQTPFRQPGAIHGS